MNSFTVGGRLTKDITLEDRKGMAFAEITIAASRAKKKDSDEGADFIKIALLGNTAENAAKYSGKGKYIIANGHVHTSTYEKEGKKITSTQMVADKLEFVEWKSKEEKSQVKEEKTSFDDYPDIW